MTNLKDLMNMTREQAENNVKLLKGQPVGKVEMWLSMLRPTEKDLVMMADIIGSGERTIKGIARDLAFGV